VTFPPTDDSVRAGYDRWSEIYDTEENPLIGLEEPYVRAAIGDVTGLDVLDLGCGTGRHTLWMAAGGATVTAVDFSDGMMAAARQKAGADRVRFLVHDLHAPLPFPAATFDLVVSGLVVEHLRDLDLFFGGARRVLRPRGRAIVSGMHPAMYLRGVQARFYDPASGEKVQPGSVPHTVGDIVMAIVRAGFTLAAIHEQAPGAEYATRCSRAAKYVGWPMLLVFQMRA
jgi:malonyl-CoA O-methyltransferase